MDRTNANLDTLNKNDTIDYFNIQDKITSVAFFPDSKKIAIDSIPFEVIIPSSA